LEDTVTAQQAQQSAEGQPPFGVWTQLRLLPAPPRRRGPGWVATIAIAAVAFVTGGLGGLLLGGTGDTPAVPPVTAPAPRSTSTPAAPKATVPDRRVAGDGKPAITNDLLGKRVARISVGAAREPAGDEGIQPRRGHWAVFEVEVDALRDDVTTPDFYVVADGHRYDRSFRAPGDPAMLRPFVTLQKGERQDGTVAFDLPARHGRLVVPGTDGKPQAIWTF
jgi:hypothetical protein